MALDLDLGDERESGRKTVFVDGVESKNSYVNDRWIKIGDEILFEKLSRVSVGEILESFDHVLVLLEKIEDVWIEVELSVSTRNPNKIKQPAISASLGYIVELWAKPWPILDQFYSMREQIEAEEGYELHCEIIDYYDDGEPDYDLLNGFGLVRSIEDQSLKLIDLYKEVVGTLKYIHRSTEEELSSDVDTEKLVTYFNFPGSVKVACEQYLIYFSQFLNDLGVQAEAELVNSGELTLLKVKPKNDKHALDEIRYLLSSYLSIATDSDVGLSPYEEKDPSVFQLESNILHLRSQLALALAVNEAKQTTIDNLRLSNYATQVINEPAEIDSLRQIENKKPTTKESLLGGIVVLSEWEISKGVTINFAEIARRLKRNNEK